MNFGELCQAVFVITGRPDLLADTQLAIQKATLKFHMVDFWKRDRSEKILTFIAASAVQVDISVQFERFRKFGTLAPFDPVNGLVLQCIDQATGNPRSLREIDPERLFDQYGVNRLDTFYMSGSSLNIRFNSGQTGLYASWYKYPLVAPNNYNSWIADMYFPIIVEQAAGEILIAIGQVEDANRFLDPLKGTIYNPLHGHLTVLRTNELEALAR